VVPLSLYTKKTLQTLGLILSAPPAGHKYPIGRLPVPVLVEQETTTSTTQDDGGGDCAKPAAVAVAADEEEVVVHTQVQVVVRPIPSESAIQDKMTNPQRKEVLKKAGLKTTGTKAVLNQRILNGIQEGKVTGDCFPESFMTVTAPPPKPIIVGRSSSSTTGTGGSSSSGFCTLIVCPVSVSIYVP
jgi:hypothetical protein